MSCTQTLSGLARDCSANMGGISEVYIANRDDIASLTVADDIVTAITMNSGAYFLQYHFAKNSASLTSTYTVDAASGVKFVTSELLLQFNRMDTTKRVEITALAVADLAVIVKDSNGLYWYLGYDEPVNISAGDGQTGAARADANRYSITLAAESAEMPLGVNDGVIDTVIES